MSMCRVVSCVVWRGCLRLPVCSLGKTASLCPTSFCTPRPNLPVTIRISWFPAFAFQYPMLKRTSFFGVSFRKSSRYFIESFNFSFFSISGWDIDLDYCNIEWFILEMNRNYSVIFETASKYCISDCFVDYDGYSISSKWFLPTVVHKWSSELNPFQSILFFFHLFLLVGG